MKDLKRQFITEKSRDIISESITQSNRQSTTNEADSKRAFSRQVSENPHLTRASIATSNNQMNGQNVDQRRSGPQKMSVGGQKDPENIKGNGRQGNRQQVGADDMHPNKWADRDRSLAGRNAQSGGAPGAAIAAEEQKKFQVDELGQTQTQYKKTLGNSTNKGHHQQKEKAKTKRVKVQANRLVLHDSMVNSLEGAGSTHYGGGKATTTKNKGQRSSMQNVFIAAAAQQAQQASQLAASQRNSPKKRYKQIATQIESNAYEFKSSTQPYLIDLVANQSAGIGNAYHQGAGPNQSRRKLIPESSMPKIQAIKGSAHHPGSQESSPKRRDQIKTTYNQYYMTQRKDVGERGSYGLHAQGNHSLVKNLAKQHALRKNQPVPIDTFNIVSNRRQSLVKAMNEANATSVAMLNGNQSSSGPHMDAHGGGSMVTIDPNGQNNDLVLPQIQQNSKSGLLHYQPNKQTPIPNGEKNKRHSGAQHNSTLKSVELQAAMNPQIYQTISPQNGIHQSCTQSMDNKFDAHRKTTASMFPKANGAAGHAISPHYNPAILNTPLQRQQAVSTNTSNNHLNKRIANIVSPIQVVNSNQGGGKFNTQLQKQHEDLVPIPGMESPQPTRRRPIEECLNDEQQRFVTAQDQRQESYASSNKHPLKYCSIQPLQKSINGAQLYQKRGSDVPVRAALDSGQLAAAENIILCDQMIKKFNVASHGRNSGAGADSKVLQPDVLDKSLESSIVKHGQSIDKSDGVDFLNIQEKMQSQTSKQANDSAADVRTEAALREYCNMVSTPDFDVDDKIYNTQPNRPVAKQQVNARKSQTVVSSADGGAYEHMAPAPDDGIDVRVTKSRMQNSLNSAAPATQTPFENRHATTRCQANSSMYSNSHSSSEENEEADDDGGSDQGEDQISEDQAEEPLYTEWIESVASLHPQPQDASSQQDMHETTKDAAGRHAYQFDSTVNSSQRVTEQLNSRQKEMHQVSGAASKGEKKKSKKQHRRQNTHHHYHIDFNFEQVNNILVSYGGIGLQHQIKQYLKKDSSRANVSLSLGIVDPQLNRTHYSRGPGSQAPGAFGGLTAGGPPPASPSKKGREQQNQPLLPELTINKSKINFAVKSFKLNGDDRKLSSRQQRDLAIGHNNNPYNLGGNVVNSRNAAQGGPTRMAKRKKHKKDWNQTIQPTDEQPQPCTASKRQHAGNKSPKRLQISTSQNPAMLSQPVKSTHTADHRYAQEQHQEGGHLGGQILTLKQNQVTLQTPQSTIGTGPSLQTPAQLQHLDKPRQSNASQASKRSKDSKGSKRNKVKASDHQNQQDLLQPRPPIGAAVNQSQITENSKALAKAQGRDVSPTKQFVNKQWHSAKRVTEASNGAPVDSKPAVFGNQSNQKPIPQSSISFSGNAAFQFNQSGLYGAKNALNGVPAAPGAIPMSLKARRQKHLSVITKANATQSHAVETPKKQIPAKTLKSGQQAKAAIVEYHSAQLRPAQRRGLEVDDGAEGVGKGNLNTLSQISSVVSGMNKDDGTESKITHQAHNNTNFSVDQGSPMPGSNRASAYPSRGLGNLPSRNPKMKSNIIMQEKKQRLVDENNKKNQQMQEQFLNANKAGEMPRGSSTAELGNALMGSPMRQSEKGYSPEPKKIKPKITDFDIQEVVGIGNFGEVHKAFNKKENRACALKALRKESVAQMKHVDHIINEREVLQFLSDKNQKGFQIQQINEESPGDDGWFDADGQVTQECPFLMGIYSSFQDKENLYFELEYIQGCTLYSQIRKHNQVVRDNMPYYAAEVLMSLEYLHENNILYRDLKPENLVISMTERGHIKLVDFGFAKRLKAPGQRTYTNCGTPAYIAPEVLLGLNGHGPEADIWSLGVLMVELASGQTPFHADSTQEVYEKINTCKPTYNKFVTKPLKDLLSKIFVPDPECRISLEQMKNHKFFKDFDFTVPMRERFLNSTAPFIPDEPMFNECADRDSEQMVEAKPKNILAAIMGNPAEELLAQPKQAQRMSFDEAHYNKFEREDKKQGMEEQTGRRKRHNPLGDFKFVRINELF